MITKHHPARYLFSASAAVLCIGMSGAFAGTPNIYTQYEEAGNPKAPAAIGKLFTNAGTCSASVVSGTNVIATAAHCCFNRSSNSWIGGWSFKPHNLALTFPWASATVLSRWISTGDRQSDLCLIKLANSPATGQSVTYYTGWLGRVWNASSVLNLHSLGFPGNIGGGATLQLCTAESFASTCGEPNTLNMGCNMTYGASGGPWIWQYRRGNYVNSVVSGWSGAACTGTFGQTYNGPRFNDTNIVPLCTAIGC